MCMFYTNEMVPVGSSYNMRYNTVVEYVYDHFLFLPKFLGTEKASGPQELQVPMLGYTV